MPGGSDEGQLGRTVVLGDRDAERGRPRPDVRGQSRAGDDRGAQRRGGGECIEQIGEHRGDRMHRSGIAGWSVSSAPIARVCTAANRCSVACNGPVSSTRSSGPIPASSASGANDVVQDAAVRSTGRGCPEVPEVTTTSKVSGGGSPIASEGFGAGGPGCR